MDDDLTLTNADSARGFLRSFPAGSRQRGEALFNRGAVAALSRRGEDFLATVNDGGSDFDVDIETAPGHDWLTVCECMEPACSHGYAAILSLLAEHNARAVQQLSAGSIPSRKVTQASPSGQIRPNLEEMLLKTLGRPLNPKESGFIRSIQEAYRRASTHRIVSSWDISKLFGVFLPSYNWESLQLWPAFPKSDYEYWLYLAHYVLEHQGSIPDFMKSITDFSVIQEPLAKWRRQQAINRWNSTLSDVVSQVSVAPVAERELELRLIIEPGGARLEIAGFGGAEFKPMKSSDIRRLFNEVYAGTSRFDIESDLIWAACKPAVDYSHSKLSYSDVSHVAALGKILRNPMLRNRVFLESGEEYPQRTEPLCWSITPPAEKDGDYRVQLVRADGTLPPPICCVVTGSRCLYVTPDGFYQGPPWHNSLFNQHGEAVIPAAALHGDTGVAFLRTYQIPIPEELRARIQVMPLDVTINCGLRVGAYGSKEECVFEVRAHSPDGYTRKWDGFAWKEAKAGRSKRSSDAIISYDDSRLAEVLKLLESLPLKPASRDRKLVIKITKAFPELFCTWLKSVPPYVAVNLEGELASLANAEVAGSIKLDVVETEIDWFDLSVVLDVKDTTLTREELRLLLGAKGKYVRLQGKGWHRLTFDISQEEDERLAQLGLNPRELTDEPQRLHALQLADKAAHRFLPEQQVEKIERRASEIRARVTPDLPPGVKAELRPYQLEGFHFLSYLSANRFGGVLADDMGLGKTLQALAWLLWLRAQPPAAKTVAGTRVRSDGDLPQPAAASNVSLVVCPKSVMDNWRAEAERFTPELRVKVWSPADLGDLASSFSLADLHVINYSQLRIISEELRQVRWLAVILDEGQYIKNPSSQTAQIARALVAQSRLVLSGTPIENRLLDLWSLMSFAMPGVLGSRHAFARVYDGKGDPLARQRLAARVRPFLLRRTKNQVAKDLPDRMEEDLFCEMEGEQLVLYKAELKRAQQMLLAIQTQKELASQQFHFLTSLLRLRQICCHPRLINEKSMATSAKVDALMEQLEPLMSEGQKVLVFSQFVEMLDLLRPALEEREWPMFYLAGSTENRGELVRQFQSATGPAVFLISLKAGGFGLNLTSASYVVLFDPWWNPAVENQAIDRTHRIGQMNKVIAYRLLIKNSIEEKIRTLQKQKKALAQDVLGEERFSQSLTLDDLRFLFSS